MSEDWQWRNLRHQKRSQPHLSPVQLVASASRTPARAPDGITSGWSSSASAMVTTAAAVAAVAAVLTGASSRAGGKVVAVGLEADDGSFAGLVGAASAGVAGFVSGAVTVSLLFSASLAILLLKCTRVSPPGTQHAEIRWRWWESWSLKSGRSQRRAAQAAGKEARRV